MAQTIWKVRHEDKDYKFDLSMLTVGRLRQIKKWFPEIGRYGPFNVAVLQGDPEAALCVAWIVKQEAGESNVPEPEKMGDFAIGDFYQGIEIIEDDANAAPVDPTPAPTPASTETPTNSESDTSGS